MNVYGVFFVTQFKVFPFVVAISFVHTLCSDYSNAGFLLLLPKIAFIRRFYNKQQLFQSSNQIWAINCYNSLSFVVYVLFVYGGSETEFAQTAN